MYTIALGYVKVPTPGTPVSLSTVITTYNAALAAAGKTFQLDANEKVHKIEAWPLLSNTGVVYLGLDTSASCSTGAVMNKSTGVGVIKAVQVPGASGHQDCAFVEGEGNENTVRIADYAIDAANANEGFMIYGFKS